MKLNSNTRLSELQNLGADSLGDIPLEELLAYVRHTCIEVSSDLKDDNVSWSAEFANAAGHIQSAIDAMNSSTHSG
jgi:hypothetical protein